MKRPGTLAVMPHNPRLRGPGHEPKSPAATLVRTWLVLGALVVCGCSSMSTIDRRIQGLMDDRTAQLGGGATAPVIREPVESTYVVDGQYDKRPKSINPSADELVFEIQTARSVDEVLERLDRYNKLSENVLHLSLEDCFRISQQSAREYIQAEEEYILDAIRLLIERHRWGPRFFDDVTVSTDYDIVNGNETAALNVINDLRVTQRLPYGGEVEARLLSRATQQLTSVVGNQYSQANELALTANVPLLRDAGLIAQEDLIQAERDLIYAARRFERFRREFFVRVAGEYFSLIAFRDGLVNQEATLQSRRRNAERRRALVRAGIEPPSEAALAEQDVLSVQNQLNDARDRYIVAKDEFKILLGIPMEVEVEPLPVTIAIPEPAVSLSEAVDRAMTFRLDYQTIRDRILDSRRVVANARNQLLPDLDLRLAAAWNTDPDDRGLPSFEVGNSNYAASVTFGLPLDREIERLNVRSAMVFLQRAVRNQEQARDRIILEARAAVRRVDTSRNALNLQERAVALNERRIEEFEAKSDQITAQQQIEAEDNLLRSRNDRDAAIRDLRTAVLNYLLATGQMRVAADGTFQPLSGMVEESAADLGESDIPPEGLPDGVGP